MYYFFKCLIFRNNTYKYAYFLVLNKNPKAIFLIRFYIFNLLNVI
jgi:hypothetical protein